MWYTSVVPAPAAEAAAAAAAVAAAGAAAASVAASDASAEEAERRLVHGVYDVIACHFDQTRHKPWPLIAAYLRALEPGSVVVDVGCGNGKYLNVTTHVAMLGSDRSDKLAQAAHARLAGRVFVADALERTLRAGCADHVLSIAVIHHLVTHERRAAAVREMLRIMRPGGTMLVYVWAHEQPRFRAVADQDVLVPWHMQRTFTQRDDARSAAAAELAARVAAEQARSRATERPAGGVAAVQEAGLVPVSARDVLLHREALDGAARAVVRKAETSDELVLHRFYHLFREGELDALVCEAGGRVLSAGYEHENWYVVATHAAAPR